MKKMLGCRRARRACRLLVPVAGVAVLMLGAGTASASEGGASFYLLGSGGPGNAQLPPLQGIFFDTTTYIYDGSASADRQFVVGGNVVANLDATIAANFMTTLWVPSTDVLGGTLAVGVALPVGRPSVDVGVVLTGPQGNQVSIDRSDAASVFGDPVLTAAMSWNAGNNMHVAVTGTVNVPIGEYREGQLANLSFNRWIADFSIGTNWHDAEAGWDVGSKIGYTFNGTNNVTDYDTGTEFHAEASVERIFSESFSLGVQVYRFIQLTGDSGAGARLGPFKGRVTGLGATAAYNFRIGRTPSTLRFRIFQEFDAVNRLEGTAAFLSLSFPISMRMPTPPPSQS